MCIIYFATHTSCTHSHLLGAWNCGLNCPADARHTFYLDNNGFECQTCVFLRGEELDPDINPVEYYPPLFGVEGQRYGEGYNWDAGCGEREGKERAKYKCLSDPESARSEWKDETHTVPQYGNNYSAMSQHHPATPHHDATTPGRHPATQHDSSSLTPQTTPRTAAHRRLVKDQLKKLSVQGGRAGQVTQPYAEAAHRQQTGQAHM